MSAARQLCTPTETLFGEIAEICAQIDRRLHNRPGTAEKGLYFWLWPPGPYTDAEVLDVLRADAATFLDGITAGGGTP